VTGPDHDDCEVLVEREVSIRMELAKQRSDLLLKQADAHKQRQALEAQHEQVCAELRRAVGKQASLGPITIGSSHPSMDNVQELVRKEKELRSELLLLKDEIEREHLVSQRELANMEIVHNDIREQLGEQLTKRIPLGKRDMGHPSPRSPMMAPPVDTSRPEGSTPERLPAAAQSQTAEKLPAAADNVAGIRIRHAL